MRHNVDPPPDTAARFRELIKATENVNQTVRMLHREGHDYWEVLKAFQDAGYPMKPGHYGKIRHLRIDRRIIVWDSLLPQQTQAP